MRKSAVVAQKWDRSNTRIAKICAVESFRVATRRIIKSADGMSEVDGRENFDVVVGP